MHFGVYQASQIGGRNYNQDRVAYAYSNEALLLVLADGMGGHLHGEIAAQIAVLTYMRAFSQVALPRMPDPVAFLRDVMRLAHDEILRYARVQKLDGNPGTTCVAAVVQDGKVCWAHVGDSRFYLMRDDAVVAVTHDHSVVQYWVDLGILEPEEMRNHPDRNKITNCLGGTDSMFVECSAPLPVRDGDVLLLCSDGLWSPLEEHEIATAFTTADLRSRLDELIGLALYREGARADNSTAVVVRLGEDEPEHRTELPACMVLDARVHGSAWFRG